MFRTALPFLLDKADDGNGGGGGGDPAKPFTDEQIAALGQIVNAAFTDKLRNFETKKLAPAIGEALKAVNWEETLSPVLAKHKPEPKDDQQPSGKPDPKVAALEAKLAEVTAQLTAQAKTTQAAQEQARDERARTALRSALGPLVRQDALDIAASHIFDARKLVTFDEQGNPLLTVKRAPYAGAAEEDVPMPLADGVQHWIKSGEGKFFAPAPSGGQDPKGGGAPRRVPTGADGLPKYDGPATTDAEKVRRMQEREAAYTQRYPHLKT